VVAISSLNPRRTLVMAASCKKLQEGDPSHSSYTDTAADRHKRRQHYLDVLANLDASAEELRSALSDALSMLEEIEARAVLLELELSSAKEAIRQRSMHTTREGRVGKLRVYTQQEIQGLATKLEEKKANKKLNGRGHGHEQGSARGEGRVRGRGQGRE
jgi:hypothetical protein